MLDIWSVSEGEMTRGEALSRARRLLGTSAFVAYMPGRAKPYRIGRDGLFHDTIACGDSWQDAIEHLVIVIHRLRMS